MTISILKFTLMVHLYIRHVIIIMVNHYQVIIDLLVKLTISLQFLHRPQGNGASQSSTISMGNCSWRTIRFGQPAF